MKQITGIPFDLLDARYAPLFTSGNLTATSPLAFNNARQVIGGATDVKLGVSAANKYLYSTALDTWTEGDITAFARTILDDADAAAVRATIGAGTGSGTVTSVTGSSPIASTGGATPDISLGVSAADRFLYSTALNTWTEGTITAAGRAILDDADAAAQRTTLGLVAGGVGDIWVEKAGDTMTGQLFVDGTADQIQLRVQANGTQTTNLQTWENSSGTPLSWITPNGAFLSSYTTTAAYTHHQFTLLVNPVADIQNCIGVLNSIDKYGSNRARLWAVKNVTTIYNSGIVVNAYAADNAITHSGSGLIGNAYCNAATLAFSSTGNITSASGFVVFPVTASSTGKPITFYGLWIQDQTIATTNYAIYTGLGDVRFGDDVLIASPTASVLTLGAGTAGIDYQLKFDGETNDGILTWMEDENWLKLSALTTTTNAPLTVFDLNAAVSTAATGFANGGGVAQTWTGETATDGTSQLMAQVAGIWVDATNATRKAKLQLSAYDTAQRIGLEVEATGSAATITMFGHTYLPADSRFLYFGAGNDMSVYYDGTNGNIDTDLVAASDLTIDCGTAKTLVLEVPVYNDANVGSLVLVTGGTLPGVVELLESDGGASGIYSRGFAVNEQGSGSLEMPHDYKEGSDIVFHVHWVGQDAPSGTDNVRWRLTYTVTRDGVVTPALTVVVDAVDTAFDTQYEWMRTDVATITGTNFKIGDQFNFTLTRIAASGDAYAGEAVVATIGFHYQCDTLGSRQIGTK